MSSEPSNSRKISEYIFWTKTPIDPCRKSLGALNRRTGREEKGRAELTAATDMYCEMGMDFWLEKAEEVLAGV